MTKFTIDIHKGELVVRGNNAKAPGGNARKRPLTDLKWEVAPHSGLVFDLQFETLEFADGSQNPSKNWPFGRVIGTDGTVSQNDATVTGATYFEAEIDQHAEGAIKYSIVGRFSVVAELDPVIIIER
jgi:hypothetical protein